MNVGGYQGKARRAALQGNRDSLVSNLDMMPTLIDMLGWDTAEHLFADVPAIFQHGAVLAQAACPACLLARSSVCRVMRLAIWVFNVILRNERNNGGGGDPCARCDAGQSCTAVGVAGVAGERARPSGWASSRLCVCTLIWCKQQSTTKQM